jgi:hypothetical protein
MREEWFKMPHVMGVQNTNLRKSKERKIKILSVSLKAEQ